MGDVEVSNQKDAEFEKEIDKRKGGRGRLRDLMKKKDPELAKAFQDMTPAQRAWGQMLGELIQAKSNDDIESAFDEFAEEHNDKIQLTNIERITAFFHALASVDTDDVQYRILRRMFLKAITNETGS